MVGVVQGEFIEVHFVMLRAHHEQYNCRPGVLRRITNFARTRTLLCLALSAILAIILSASTGGALVYTTVPKDGLSPPWYPSREYTSKYSFSL